MEHAFCDVPKVIGKIITHDLSESFDFIEVYPLSDLHIGDRNADEKMFKNFVNYILDKPNRFVIYNGDNANNATKNSVSNVYTATKTPYQQKQFLKAELEPIRSRILAVVEGNHEARSAKESDSHIVEDIAEYLGLKEVYRSEYAIMKVTFGKNYKGKRQCYTFYITHGSGGGVKAGSAINKAESVGVYCDADVNILGHFHKKIGYKPAVLRLDLRNNAIVQTPKLYVISSSWLNYGGYGAKGMFTPSAKGSVPITLYAYEKRMFATI